MIPHISRGFRRQGMQLLKHEGVLLGLDDTIAVRWGQEQIVDLAITNWELVVLPYPVDHAVALSFMLTQWGFMHSFVLDIDTTIPLHPEERRFCAAEVSEELVVWRVVGFCGREFPWCSAESFPLKPCLARKSCRSIGS
eukprot:2815945-Amphidinium_carterae.1